MHASAVSAPSAARELDTLTRLSSYEPAASDNVRSLEPCASVDRRTLFEEGPSPRNDPFTPAACPLPRVRACRVRRDALGGFRRGRRRRLANSEEQAAISQMVKS